MHPSLSLTETTEGVILLHCFAGCPYKSVIHCLRQKGLWPGHRKPGRSKITFQHRAQHPERGVIDWCDRDRRIRAARQLWQASGSVLDTVGEIYLRGRGIDHPPPPALRFHACLRHGPTGTSWPALVAAVTDASGEFIGVCRTFLATDGHGKAPVEPVRLALGPIGGGGVRLAEVGDSIQVAEGVETALAVMQATTRPTLAALSTSGLRALILPQSVRQVTIFADGDDPGDEAAIDCARRWRAQGLEVRIARPPLGSDFLDLLSDYPAQRVRLGVR